MKTVGTAALWIFGLAILGWALMLRIHSADFKTAYDSGYADGIAFERQSALQSGVCSGERGKTRAEYTLFPDNPDWSNLGRD